MTTIYDTDYDLNVWRLELEPNGTTATARLQIHDDSDYAVTYDILLEFADPALNMFDGDAWFIPADATLVYRQIKDKRELMDKAGDIARRFYYHLMKMRTSYGQETTVNAWRVKYEAAHEEILAKQRKVQDLEDTVRWRDARIKELETDYVRLLEARIMALTDGLKRVKAFVNDIYTGSGAP